MSLITFSQMAERYSLPDTSLLRKDATGASGGPICLAAKLYGKTDLVEETEAERWYREEWPRHQKNRKKKAGTRRKQPVDTPAES